MVKVCYKYPVPVTQAPIYPGILTDFRGRNIHPARRRKGVENRTGGPGSQEGLIQNTIPRRIGGVGFSHTHSSTEQHGQESRIAPRNFKTWHSR